MARKKTETKQEVKFTKEQILASNKYANKRDVLSAILPKDFFGSAAEVDDLFENFMKGKVK